MHRDFMARRWCGFSPQNQEAKEQWGLLEATKIQIEGSLEQFLGQEKPEPLEQQEGEELYLVRLNRAH